MWGRGGWTWPGLASARVPARNSLLTHARAAGAEPRGPVSGQDARADPAAERRHHVGEGRHVDAFGWKAQDQDGHLRPTRRARCRARRHTCRPLVGVTLGFDGYEAAAGGLSDCRTELLHLLYLTAMCRCLR